MKGFIDCLGGTSDAADAEDSVDLGGRRGIKTKMLRRLSYLNVAQRTH